MADTKTDIFIKGVNVPLLRKQRDLLLDLPETYQMNTETKDLLEGMVTLLDEMLDVAEGYKT